MGVSVLPAVGFLAGMVMAYAGATTQPGWLLCDGSLLNRADYPQLFAAIGTTYNTGGESGTQFRIPNLKGKVIVMQDTGQTEFDAIGESGGSKSSTAPHTHSLSDHRHGLEAHTHPFTSDYRNTNHAHNVYSRDINHDHAINHWHSANIAQVKAWSGFSHQHVNAGGYAAEGAEQGSAGAGAIPVNVDGNANAAPGGTNISGGMRQSNPHDHPSTNYASESPWPGDYNHQHAGTTGGWNNPGGWASPNNDTSGASSAGATSGNLQPYMVMNYLIKV